MKILALLSLRVTDFGVFGQNANLQGNVYMINRKFRHVKFLVCFQSGLKMFYSLCIFMYYLGCFSFTFPRHLRLSTFMAPYLIFGVI